MKNLKTLLESDLLNEETRTVLKEAWDAAVEQNRVEIEAEYAEKLNAAQTELTENAMNLIEAAVNEQMEAVAEEIAEARTLELKYATLLEDFKGKYAEKMDEQIKELVAESVAEEISELKEDIEFARKHQFGVKIYESFKSAYVETFGEDDASLKESYDQAMNELNELRREKVLNGLLESVSGEKRNIVKTMLESVPTEKLEAKFESLRPVILKENEEVVTETKDDKEVKGTIVIESVNEETKKEGKKDFDPIAERINRSLRIIR